MVLLRRVALCLRYGTAAVLAPAGCLCLICLPSFLLLSQALLSTYPKRLDVWNVYLDQEISTNNLDSARRLFNRVITLKLSSKKMKSMFKKYLRFEAEHGDAAGVARVKELAEEYVARHV